MFLSVKNRASSTLAADISADATSLTVVTNEGAKFPSANFHITIEDEILLCTTRSTDTFTVKRAKEGTIAASHITGKAVKLRVTARIIRELQQLYGFDNWKRLLATRPDEALKILKKVWTGATGEDNCFTLTFDGAYIYIGLNTSPAKVIKINPDTMATVSTWTGATGEDSCLALTFDGTYIYAGFYISPAKVIRKIMRNINETGV